MKIVSELKDLCLLKNTKVDGWIVNVFGLSCYYDHLYSLEEIESIVDIAHRQNQKVYVNAKKIIHEQDIDKVTYLVKELEKIGIDYYIYGDVAFLEIVGNLQINAKLIYQVATYMTNKYDINEMLKDNNSVVVSTELSLEEMKEIINDTPKELYLHAFGYYPIFHSRRELISNYLIYRNREIDLEANYDVVEELRKTHYPIEQNENGMVVYLDGAYNLTEELVFFENATAILLSKFISLEDYQKVLEVYTNNGNYQELGKLNIVLSKGLLYEQSILLKKEGGMVCE